MDFKINYENILNDTGIKFDDIYSLLYFLQNNIDYLFTHNKNYTKTQYNKIIDLKEIINNISIYEK